MRFIFAVTFIIFGSEFVKASQSDSSHKGMEVNCEINASFVKDPAIKDKSKLSVDMRIVSLPALKLSGKKIILDYGGAEHGCQNTYYAEVDDKLLVTICSDHQPGEALNFKEVKFHETKASENSEWGPAKKDYFCVPKNSGTAGSKPMETKNNNGAP